MVLAQYENSDETYNISTIATQFFDNIDQDVQKIYDKHNINKQYSLTNISVYKKYKSINYILGIIILLCIVLVVLTMMNKNMSYFDDNSYIVIVSIVLALSIVYIIKLVFDTTSRSNINFDEYEFSTSNNKIPSNKKNTKASDYVLSDISLCNI
jgi:hypothetical protein